MAGLGLRDYGDDQDEGEYSQSEGGFVYFGEQALSAVRGQRNVRVAIIQIYHLDSFRFEQRRQWSIGQRGRSSLVCASPPSLPSGEIKDR